ncbi:guanine nucleotide binding protein, alpha subunit [Favolaschia claudopus]|uniref:Guanine nucleotide binding protein, alpha subunit n=1 Tax=Favolaschia claudopus TaxID=2862362 RepID=A0AAW0DS37_9AGAR
MPLHRIDEDPLAVLLAPPPNETPSQREARERAESEAKRVSDEIDAQLRKERDSERKKKPVKLLLLGQSESGKTATLKNFQLLYCKRQWAQERASWRFVVLLNLVRNVNDILDIIAREIAASNSHHMSSKSTSAAVYPTSRSSSPSSSPLSSDNEDEIEEIISPAKARRASTGVISPSKSKSKSAKNSMPRSGSISIAVSSPSPSASSTTKTPKDKDLHRLSVLRMRLLPLRRVQAELETRLGTGATELYTSNTSSAAPFADSTNTMFNGEDGKFDPSAMVRPAQTQTQTQAWGHKEKEFSIHSTNGWKTALERLRAAKRRLSGGRSTPTNTSSNPEDELLAIIAASRDDMRSVWEDRLVREMLARKKGPRVEEGAGFFLTDLDRIARTDYQITDDDIIRARLRTVGVQEYRVSSHSAGSEWRMYDVGGTRSSRAVWYSYFDDVDAIIFLAPVSCFDEKLAEDRRVYMLWKSVCACKLLARTQLVLFLNKCDLLQAKLMRGIKIRDSVPSFGDRRNDVATATRYFQQHFKEIQRTYSPVQRPFYVHLTSVIESILRDHLRRADLM